MKVKAVVFDADGVVLATSLFSQRYSKDFGVPIEKILAYIKNEHQLCLVGQASFRKEITKYLNEWKWNRSVDDLIEYWFSGEKEVIPRTMEFITYLKRNFIPVYLATNQIKDRTDYFISNLNFGKIFDKIYSSANIGYKKNPARNFTNT